MRRADRLFQIIQFLRSRRLTTAKWLAERFELSERTIYRDIQHLICTGVPIEGEAGVGYIIRKEYSLPPLMFNLDEITSLVIGSKMAMSLGGNIHKYAETALSKLNSTLPIEQQQQINDIKVFSPMKRSANGEKLTLFNQAIREKRSLLIYYQKPHDTIPIAREIYPLGLFFWHDKWTMVGWCLLRESFRHFRLDRITSFQLLNQSFTLTKEQSLDTFFSLVIPSTQIKKR